MEAKDPCADCPDIILDDYGYYCDLACGKRTAWLNYQAGYNKALAQLAEMTEECKQMGRREVVELIDNTGLIEHTDSQLHETGATILDCPACCWYAYKAKWGVDKPKK